MKRSSSFYKQRGVAVIMALLLTALAITLVASLFWQQQVQVRLIENQRLQLQKQWILRGALDWASLILREDAKHSSVDTLDEPWATPLAETRLDQYVENGKADSDNADTTLAGSISDAQARFNLSNLCPNGTIDPAAVASYAKLLTLLHINPELAQTTATKIALSTTAINASATQPSNNNQPAVTPATAAITTPPLATNVMHYTQIDDLLVIAGYTPALVAQLKPYIIFLPTSTPLNINTASAEVISATLPNLSLADANALIATRKTAYFRDAADLSNRLKGTLFDTNRLSVTSHYFLVNGKVHMNRARLDSETLLARNGITLQQIWTREF